MLRQIRYFQAVVKSGSFSEAAEECHVSQSAVSQGIQALERALGFELLERRNRRFVLTPAGSFFYSQSAALVADYERICRQAVHIAQGETSLLRVGYLRTFCGSEFRLALASFAAANPQVVVTTVPGSHEELFELLRTDAVDLAFSDQRRAFSDEYVNMVLASRREQIEIAAHSPIASLPAVQPARLKDLTCILVAPAPQHQTERDYYHDVVGLRSEVSFAEDLQAARLLVVGGQGFLPAEGVPETAPAEPGIVRVPLVRGQAAIVRNFCAFWKRNNGNIHTEAFAAALRSQFSGSE